MVVENGVCLSHEVVGQRPRRHRQSTCGTAIGVDRFQPQVARQPTVVRRFAYAAQSTRDHRPQSHWSRRGDSVIAPVIRWLDITGSIAASRHQRRRRVQKQRHDTEPGPPHGDHWPSRKFRRMAVQVRNTNGRTRRILINIIDSSGSSGSSSIYGVVVEWRKNDLFKTPPQPEI